ncbi:DUF3024 domain-containing protein [Paenibacillus sp. PR3]|uniref:DUF3024 domain-containing protein n=1 Tax=Paenibacillus terricola TaxID=2763503 RepID=A0ABR8N4E5_9BACL|nr:DUF3024 domain-containing protein [Paenibacillus terricola]MBD3922146.1 DUF3024 domain-containing protein [Paenibacillus terricola]
MDDFTKKRIEKIMNVYIEQKVPKHIRNQIRLNYKIRGNNVTLNEERPAFKSTEWVELPVAQFRLEQNQWKVYWRDSKNKWHFVEDIAPHENFETQLMIVEEDSRGVFWN